jgi:IrrE N-terminal-like domain
MDLRVPIGRLEEFAHRCGAPVVRNSLVAGVLGRVDARCIVLRAGLSLEQQLLTLVHELTHLILHYNVSPRIDRTVCEYEAEAVERWVGDALQSSSADEDLDAAALTDDLLACSVIRVRWASQVILRVARDGALPPFPGLLQPQAAVELDAATREEVVFNDELHGVRDFIRLAEPL